MLRLILSAIAAALLLAACAGSDATTEPVPSDAPLAATPGGPVPVVLDAALPLDPSVRTDTLANGLVYYLRRNTEPANRAELRLVVDAGSALEDDDQRGLAHFLEHMLFNGTERFPEQELVSFLERTGMEFGPDVNAYTSFDETVYMLQIPTDSTSIVETAFDVLQDWAGAATLSDSAIDEERGVIVEEWRLSDQNAGGRIRDQVLPVLLDGSRYADRLPIGDTTTILNAPPQSLRRYYQTWYRPNLMAIVVVGDVDLDRYEALIREHFSSLENPTDPVPRPVLDVPISDSTRYVVATDPEYPAASVQVGYKREARPLVTIDDYRHALLNGAFNGMLNARLSEITRQGDAPFLGASVGEGSFVRPLELYTLAARVEEDSVLTGLAALLAEAERVRRYGFTPTEWEREREETLRAFRRAYDERDNLPSASLASEYVTLFLEGDAAPGIGFEYELVQTLLASITVEDVNARASQLLDPAGRVVIATMPEKPGLTPPTKAALAATLEAMQNQALDPYDDDVTDADLIAAPPPPAAVVARDSIPELGVQTVTLANGVRLILKPTDFKVDEVRFVASSPGGTSLVPDSLYFAASQADALVALGGVGAFDRTALEKKLAGQVVGVRPYISELEEGLRGSASPEDLETLFQLIHLYVTAPRADAEALAVQQNNLRAALRNRSSTPGGVLQDTLLAALYGDHPRRGVPTLDQIESLKLDEAIAIYRDRFADASDFTFTFVGAFEPDRLIELAQTYLGTLPATGRTETWRNVAPDPPEGVVEKIAVKGQEAQSIVYLYFSGPADPAPANRLLVSALENVLSIVVRDELREARGGIYSPFVNASLDTRPEPRYAVTVGFGCDPARAEELAQAVFAEVDSLQAVGPSDDTVAKVKEQLRRSREESLEQNAFWVSALDYYFTASDEDPRLILGFDERVAEIVTAEALQAAARRYLLEERYVQVTLYPEAYPLPTN